jgi:gas vesicle protein
MAEMKKASSSHLGAGLAAGAALGLAAGLFLQSRKGKELTRDAMKKAQLLQKQVQKKIKIAGNMTKDKYEEIVDYVVEYYSKTKEIAEKEIPTVRKFLMDQWKGIESEMKKK